jgi:hypothetical protein
MKFVAPASCLHGLEAPTTFTNNLGLLHHSRFEQSFLVSQNLRSLPSFPCYTEFLKRGFLEKFRYGFLAKRTLCEAQIPVYDN